MAGGSLGEDVAGRGAGATALRGLPPAAARRIVSDHAPAPLRDFALGRTRCAGRIVFAHETTHRIPLNATTSESARVQHQIIAFLDQEIEAIDEVWFDNEVIPLEADGAVSSGHTLRGWAFVNKHLGRDSQTVDTDLRAAAPNQWTGADRLRGVTYLYCRFVLLATKYPNGRAPNVTIVARGAKPFDPRDHLSVYSANAALCARWYLYNRRFGFKARPHYTAGTVAVTNGSAVVTGSGAAFLANTRPGDQFDVAGDGAWGQINTVDSDTQITLAAPYGGVSGTGKSYAISSDVDEASFVTAANRCDEAVNLAAGGTEPRYEAHGQLSTSDGRAAVLAAFRLALAGDIYRVSGKWAVRAGGYDAPIITLDDDDLIGAGDLRLRRADTQLFNSVVARFRSPDHLWQTVPAPAVTDAGFVADDNGEALVNTIYFPLTQSGAAVQRIAKILLRRARQQEGAKITTKPTGFRLTAGSTLSFTNADAGWSAKTFRVSSATPQFDGEGLRLSFDLTAEDASVYDWSAEEGALSPLELVNPPPSAGGPAAGIALPPPFTRIFRLSDRLTAGEGDDDLENLFDLRVSGLELDNGGDGNDTEFIGADAAFVWRDNALVDFAELGDEAGGAGSGERDPNFKDWMVKILNPDDSERRTEFVHTPAYVYTFDRNLNDGLRNDAAAGFKTAVRSLIIEVYTRTVNGDLTNHPARLLVTNPAPELPVAFTIEGGDREITIKDIAPSYGKLDADLVALAVWLSETSGFTPDNTTLVYQGAISTVSISALADTQYYLVLAFYDAFGIVGLNQSPEQSVLTGGDLNVTLPDANPVVWDLSKATYAVVTIAGDRALWITNIRAGTFILEVVQGAGGGHALTYPAVVKFIEDIAPDHSTGTEGKAAIITFVSNGVKMRAVSQQFFG